MGLGWYGGGDGPGLYRSIAPAWGDRNLRELAGQIESPLFLAHIRAATGTPIEQTNCHPFRHGRWLFMHNGFIDDYLRLRRELLLAVDPVVFTGIEGTTDSELMFHLALTFGLEQEPLTALERMAGFVEETGRRHGVAEPLQMTVAVSDGERLYAARYASGPVVNSLYVTADRRSSGPLARGAGRHGARRPAGRGHGAAVYAALAGLTPHERDFTLCAQARTGRAQRRAGAGVLSDGHRGPLRQARRSSPGCVGA